MPSPDDQPPPRTDGAAVPVVPEGGASAESGVRSVPEATSPRAQGSLPPTDPTAAPPAPPSLSDATRLLGQAIRREGAAGARRVGETTKVAAARLQETVDKAARSSTEAVRRLSRPAGERPRDPASENQTSIQAAAMAKLASLRGMVRPAEPVAEGAATAAPVQARAPRRKRAPGTRAIRFSWRLLMWSLFLLAFGAGATALAVWLVMRDLPLADILPQIAEPTVSVETADGQVLTTQGAYQAPYVALDEFPPHLIDAVLSIEDRRFFEHSGVDPRGISRALYRNVTAGGVVEGGSTITQQLVKILYLEPERTISRKLQEAVLATTLERQLGKERILELYLNSVYLGSGAYGMPAAAETYYDVDAGELSLAQAATLAASIQLPSQVNPVADLPAVQERAGLVLRLMEEQGRIEGPAREAAAAELAALAPDPPATRAGSYFADWVLEEVEGLEGASSQSLSATATLDTELQAQTEAIVRRVMAEEGAPAGASQAAVVVMTPSGRVRAMVGGLDYDSSEFNRATDAMRQPGSTFKTFVYMAALVMGASPDNTVEDTPIEIAGWAPQNFNGQSHGTVNLRDAFAQSYNQAAVRLGQSVGNDNIIEVARRFGIESDLRDQPSLPLGTSETSLLDMTEAFAALALGRMPVNATGIETLRFGEEGEALGVTGVNDREQTRLTRTREPMLDLLRAVVTDGTGRGAAVEGLDILGKTGTSQESRDAWFIGFAQGQGIVVGVWVGNDDNSPMTEVTGGGIPATIFREVMAAAVARQGGAAPTVAGADAPQAVPAQATPLACDIRACSAAYRSFDAATCTYQPWEGPRRLCTR